MYTDYDKIERYASDDESDDDAGQPLQRSQARNMKEVSKKFQQLAVPIHGPMAINEDGRNLFPPRSITINMAGNNTKFQWGDQYYTRTHHKEEVFKAKFLCLRFKSEMSMKRFRCSLGVCLAWTLLVACAIASYIIIFVMPQHQGRKDIGLKAEWYLHREQWLPLRVADKEFLDLPLQYVLIGHAENYEYCDSQSECKKQVKIIQQTQIWRGFKDIGANFLVGGKGYILEGTGANIAGAMTWGWEYNSISIMFIGNFVKDSPNQLQLDHIKILLEVLMEKNVLRSDYILYGSCQVDTRTVSPGPKIMRIMHQFDHWDPRNETKCLPGILI